MNMKRNLINMAVLSTLGLAATAGAVTTGSTGEVLIYPYYTVRDGNDTLITVVNTTDKPKAVKVRFLEAKNSQEVIDFNLYLSKYDVWSAVVTSTATGAKFATTDKSCTVPAIPAGGVEFRNFQFSGEFADGEDDSLNRTREGYIEIIEMGVPLNVEIGTDADGDPIFFDKAITHKNGVPENCAAVVKDWTDDKFTPDSMSAPIGGLMGTGTLINVNNGTDFSYDPVVLDDFSDSVNHTEPGSLAPSLTQASPAKSVVFYDDHAVTSYWDYSNAANPVSALIMRTNVLNEFTVEPDLAAGTDWVVNFPTKRFYVELDVPSGSDDPDSAEENFERPFTQDFKKNGACEEVKLDIYDREERTTTSELDFSPPPPEGKNALCWEVNVITFNNTNVLGSELAINVPNSGFNSGWLNLGFADSVKRPNKDAFPRSIVSDEGDTYFGLPVIGFGVQEYVNGNLGGVLSNYGGSFIHKYKRSIDLAND